MHQHQHPSILTSLRRLIPNREIDEHELRVVAEAQANRLIEAVRGIDPGMEGITARHIGALPRIRIAYDRLPVSGLSHWNGQAWVIALNDSDSEARQRFTLLHEFKYIIDHGATGQLYHDIRIGGKTMTADQQAEHLADYFAACTLIPRRDLKRAWGNGLQRTDQLADHFGVSQAAMEIRLDETGLSRAFDPEPQPPRARCARLVRTSFGQPQRFRPAMHAYVKRSYV
ncbi:ImmA/IrrE family metallo-endopeptidase [Nakamurella multipartita]|uniref:IrrE N-terminal-like domain-containing protein n=1 Tax=Nakamurella multipartita (strain ATCC 700099 / DSM 44233 / CIP 104796 / JCM 9543 / NBRC 105858 / Y-104) TaxID=479431 RepID=C8XI69_NAKMY|nr:ImmA/IrrE family metallo-endopeptidase [Nakamurella multipartita]ACV78438.1 protein of unknown function DUF955 [Nakamurella multipartita DSM 44233]